MSKNTIAGIALAAVVGSTLYFNLAGQPASTIKDRETVKEVLPPNMHFYKSDKDGVGKLIIKDKETGSILADFSMDTRGILYQPKDYKGNLEASFLSDYYLLDWTELDFGAIAAMAYGAKTHTLQPGLRVSPVRLLYGTMAADVVLTQDFLGVGASFYMPAKYAPSQALRHLGIGAWYCTNINSNNDNPALLLGLTFSTKF
jgi:hypothetical protein